MISGEKVLAVIPARGGSKGIPRKNIIDVAGKPLIAWTIEEAKKSQYLDRIILSSDDDEIIAVARAWGCEVPFKRPAQHAQDDTPGIMPVLHALAALPEYGYVVLLQPTSPLRTAADIDACLESCINASANCCVSVAEPEQSPYWMYHVSSEGLLIPLLDNKELITRRQDHPAVYALNGAVYVARSKWLLETKIFITKETLAYLMPRDNSIDIDSQIDLDIAELLLKKRQDNSREGEGRPDNGQRS